LDIIVRYKEKTSTHLLTIAIETVGANTN